MALPGAADDVVIDVAGNPTIDFSSGTTSVNSLTVTDSLSITGGSLTVHADSSVSGAFSMTGGTFTASGAGVTFTASGTTTVDGGSLAAAAGATISLPNLTSYTNTTTSNDQTRTLSASGTGSTLDLHSVVTITNGMNYNAHLAISASGGGTIDLSGTTSIVDPNTGDQRYRSIDVTADGLGSTVDLSALASFTDNSGGSPTGANRYSTLTARNLGIIEAGVLETLVGVNVTIDGTGSMPTAQITSLDTSALSLSGSATTFDFSGLTTATTSVLSVDAATLSVPALADIDGSSLLVTSGGTLALPAVTSYTNTTTGNDQTRTLSASGAGSMLDLHNVTTVTNGQDYNAHVAISATGGGTIDLSGTTAIVDPDSGDQRYRSIDVTADGMGSTIDLSALASFSDHTGGSPTGANRYSSLTARNSGTIQAGLLTTLLGVSVTIDATGTMSTAQITSLDTSACRSAAALPRLIFPA